MYIVYTSIWFLYNNMTLVYTWYMMIVKIILYTHRELVIIIIYIDYVLWYRARIRAEQQIKTTNNKHTEPLKYIYVVV